MNDWEPPRSRIVWRHAFVVADIHPSVEDIISAVASCTFLWFFPHGRCCCCRRRRRRCLVAEVVVQCCCRWGDEEADAASAVPPHPDELTASVVPSSHSRNMLQEGGLRCI